MAVGSISNVYPGGERPSGLPVDITQQLVDAKRQQLVQPLEQDRQELQGKTERMQQLNGLTQAVGQAAGKLDDASDLEAYSATSSDSTAVTATVTGSPQPGNYNVDLSGSSHQRAQASNLLVGQDTGDGTNDTVETADGISDPASGAAISDGVDLQFDHQGTEYTYTTDSDTSLNSLAAKIDSDNNGVSASATNIGTSDEPAYVLQLQSESTGGGGNQITKVGSDTEGLTTSGDLFTNGTNEVEVAASGQNAVFDVDGVTYERATNKVSDAIPGVELDLQKAGSQVNIGVSQDTEQITQNMKSLVDEVNKVSGFIDETTKYNAESGEAGPLMGNATVRQVDSALRGALGERVAGTEDQDLQYLNDVGLSFERDGQMSFDSDKFQQALSNNPQEVQNLLAGEDGAMTRLSEEVDGLTGRVNGTITNALDTLESRDSRLQNQIEEANSRVQEYEQRISQRYAELEKTVVELQKVEDQISNLTSSGSGG